MTFPTHSPEILSFLREIRCSLDVEPDERVVDKIFALCRMINELHNFEYEVLDNHIVIDQDNQIISFPLPLPRSELELIACGYAEWSLNKYSLKDFVEVEPGDTVIDCGAFVGGFSVACAKTAGLIIGIEPSAHIYSCLDRNLQRYENGLALRIALGDQPGISKLNVSISAVKHSLHNTEDEVIDHREAVAIMRLDDLAKAIGVSKIDFLKLEVGGCEPEIINSLGLLLPEKIAIDISSEQDKKPPSQEIAKDLQERGYQCRQRGNVLFARRIA